MKCLALVISVIALVHLSFGADVDPSLLEEIFGTPQTPDPSTSTTSTTTERPVDDKFNNQGTSTSSPFMTGETKSCKCVPYYLCKKGEGIVDDPTITGTDLIDIRFGDDDEPQQTCSESLEVCCEETKPQTEDIPTVIEPDSSGIKGCGYRKKGLEFNVSGGKGATAQFGEFPWTVAILDRYNYSYTCAGSLIHPSVVITAAHCVQKRTSDDFLIRAGEWDTKSTTERLKYQERNVAEISMHPKFFAQAVYNDVALLRLENPVDLADHINVICLPSQNENFDSSKNCAATGWGKDKFGLKGQYAAILKKVLVDIVPHDRCESLLRKTRLGKHFKLHNSFVCAGGEEGKDTCQGDGGGPLSCPFGDDRSTLTGMVAWGIGCGMKDVPAVYVNVAKFRNWIDDNIRSWGIDTDGYTA